MTRNPGACRHRGGSLGNADAAPAIYRLIPHRSMPPRPPDSERTMDILLTSAGRRMACEPRAIVSPRDPTDAMAFAVAADRRADLLLAKRRWLQADGLAHAAYEAGARANFKVDQTAALHDPVRGDAIRIDDRRTDLHSRRPPHFRCHVCCSHGVASQPEHGR